jgi:uncharacterized protein YutE (UPF0331/DUF86 family)
VVDQSVLVSRLSTLEGYLAKLRTFSTFSRDDFLADEDVHHLAERYLHLACECVLDIAQHVISDMGYRQPEGYKDTMDVLRDEEILGDELADRLKGWMGFRNVLVHLYLEIDHRESYKAILEDLGDLEAFAERMTGFLSD